MNLLNKFEIFITGKEDVEVSDITDFYNCSQKQSSNDNRQNELDGKKLKNGKMLLLNAINAENFKTEFEQLKEYQASKNASKSRSKPKASSADRRYINVTNNSNNRLN